MLRAAGAIRTQQLAAAACLLFIALHISDGLWKPGLLRGPTLYFWAYDFFAWVVFPALALLMLHHATSLSFRDYGLEAQLGWQDVMRVLPLPLFSLFAVNMLAYGLSQAVFDNSKPEFSYVTGLQALGPLWIVGTLYLAATAGLWESVFYAGLPWYCISRTLGDSPWSRRGFILASAILFAAAHHENGVANVAGAFFFQLGAAIWYLRLGTLWPIIAAHALIDLYYFWPWPWAQA